MARIRTIKPEFFSNERLSALPETVHFAAAGLLTYADDYGYFNANPGLIKAALFPLREPLQSVPEILRSLQTIDYVRIGKGSDGRDYGWIVEFETHQRVSHPTASKIKPLCKFPEPLRNPPENFVPEQGTGNRERNREKEEDKTAPSSANSSPMVPVEHPELNLSPVFVSLPLNTGRPFEIREALVAEFGKLYPAVDVAQQLRAMKGWLDSNPRKRKTRAGVMRFVNGWLAKEQDRGGSRGVAKVSTAGSLAADEVH